MEKLDIHFQVTDEEQVRIINKIKPPASSASGFIKEMAMVGLEHTIADSDLRRKFEKNIVKEIKLIGDVQQSVVNHLVAKVGDLEQRLESLPAAVLNAVSLGLAEELKAVLDESVKSRKEKDGSVELLKQDIAYKDVASQVAALAEVIVRLNGYGVLGQYLSPADLQKIQGKTSMPETRPGAPIDRHNS